MKHKNKIKLSGIMVIIAGIVLVVSIICLIFGRQLAAAFDVIGIRVATLFVAFAAFCSTSVFSYLIYNQNKIVRNTNEDANKRAELFRELQFSSDNYSIVNFFNGMTIHKESSRYIARYVLNQNLKFHMLQEDIVESDIYEHPDNYDYITLQIPYRVVESKPVASIVFEKLKFERNDKLYRFTTPKSEDESFAFLLFNESTKNNNILLNLIVKKDSDFFDFSHVNVFSKIKITLKISSLLGVDVRGFTELYFTNPERQETDGCNTYDIYSSIFILTDLPKISDLVYNKNKNKM